MKHLFLAFFLCIAGSTYCQDSIPKQSESWRNLYVPKTLLRIGVGYQSAFYTELGFTRRKYHGSDLHTIGTAYYGTIEWSPETGSNSENLYGLKFGGEITTQPFSVGIEGKYQTNFSNAMDVVLTPKIGLGILSTLYLYYGYNISFNKHPFESAGKNQFSLIVNPVILSYVFNKKRYTQKLYK